MIPLLIASSLFTSGSMEISAGKVDFEEKLLSFSEKVHVNLPRQAVLTCTSACYDTETKKLILKGTLQDKISYNEPNLAISCCSVATELGGESSLQNLTAEGNVKINYGEDVTIVADRGYYLKTAEDDGMLTLVCEQPDTQCQLFHSRGDTFKASTVLFDVKKNLVTLNNPTGVIVTEPNETEVSAQSFTWDLSSHVMTLSHNIRIAQHDLGVFTASDKLEIQQTAERKLQRIKGTGTINVVLSKNQTLDCQGTFILDPTAETLTIVGTPIVFKDTIGEIEAERAVITYKDKKPTFITVEGQVKIQDFATVENITSDTCLHLILTDYATLDPAKQELFLKAKPDNRTLVYDKINNIQVSAPAITVQRNKETNKDRIQGQGDVRFSFSEKELNLFKQRFKMIQNERESAAKS